MLAPPCCALGAGSLGSSVACLAASARPRLDAASRQARLAGPALTLLVPLLLVLTRLSCRPPPCVPSAAPRRWPPRNNAVARAHAAGVGSRGVLGPRVDRALTAPRHAKYRSGRAISTLPRFSAHARARGCSPIAHLVQWMTILERVLRLIGRSREDDCLRQRIPGLARAVGEGFISAVVELALVAGRCGGGAGRRGAARAFL